jgi:hypothetical protein
MMALYASADDTSPASPAPADPNEPVVEPHPAEVGGSEPEPQHVDEAPAPDAFDELSAEDESKRRWFNRGQATPGDPAN